MQARTIILASDGLAAVAELRASGVKRVVIPTGARIQPDQSFVESDRLQLRRLGFVVSELEADVLTKDPAARSVGRKR